jgi:peptide/nickel transport system permease protein
MASVEASPFTPRIRLQGPPAWRDADRVTKIACVWLALLVFAGVIGLALPIGSSTAIGVGPRLAGPSGHWLFGTDELGRSLLPRVIEGLRTTFLLASIAVVLTTLVGGLIGMVAGYKRGVIDGVTSRLTEVLFAFPALLLAMLISVVVGYGSWAAIISIVLITVPLMIRVVRAETLIVSQRDFVVVAQVGGASLARILLRHITPNVAGAVVTQAAYAMSLGMLIESGLSFLGLGVQPPGASLGSLVRDGTEYLTVAPWLVFIPGAALASAILAVNLIGDGLRDSLDRRRPRSLE